MSVRDDQYDVAVVGVDGMGSATVYYLANRSLDVVGLERYDIPYSQGSPYGITHIIYRAYYEHPSYVPLIKRTHDPWNDLADETGRDITHRAGSTDAGPVGNDVFAGSKRFYEEYDIPHGVLTGTEVSERFPGYELPKDYRTVYQEDNGFIAPERSIIDYIEATQARGAEIRARGRVENWAEANDGGVHVCIDHGVYVANAFMFAAGAWNYKLADMLDGLAIPERQMLVWFQPESPATLAPEEFPIRNPSAPESRLYGFPVHDVPGLKLGKYHHRDEEVDPDDFDREPNHAGEAILRSVTRKYFPKAVGPTMSLTTCMFTNSPDEHLTLDTLLDHLQVTAGAGFSGRDLKSASVIGKILAGRVGDGESDLPLDMFSLDRSE